MPKPTDPIKNGYTFKGWFEGEAETAFDFENTQITADKMLKARWEIVTYTITYELNGGTKVNENDYPATYTIETDDITLPTPTAPTDKPYFAGWYSEQELKNKATKIAKGSIGNKTFYAKWDAEAIVECTVTFKLVGAEGETTAKVNKGDIISDEQIEEAKKQIPEGYELKGTYSDKGCTTEFVFTQTPITADTIIYVKVEKKATEPTTPENPDEPENPGEPTEPEKVSAISFTIKTEKQWSAGVFNVKEDWASLEVKFEKVPSAEQVQFCITSDAEKEAGSKEYYSMYPQVAETVTLNIEDWLNNQKDEAGKSLADYGATKITSIGIQFKAADVPEVKVASAIVTKKDGTKVAAIAEKDWASTVTISEIKIN